MYIGRFAPSPTGPLHFGSLVAALGSFLDARARGGLWLVRIEDIDPPREQPGASDAILHTLDAFGLHWDGEVLYQGRRSAVYEAALERLARDGLTYPCACSRKEIAEASARRGLPPGVYPGRCRSGLPPGRRGRALRLRVDETVIEFDDGLQGAIRQDLAAEVGDFIIRRADGPFAYHLAVVVDDAEQGITHIVRGADLLDSTPRQIYLQRLLGVASPHYLHLPVAVDARGDKLSKQTHAAPLEPDRAAGDALWHALNFLQQVPPAALRGAPPAELLGWAVSHWAPEHLPASQTRLASDAVSGVTR